MPFPGLLSGLRAAMLGSLGAVMAMQGFLLVSGSLLAHLLGVEGRGQIALLVLVPIALSQLGSLGLPQALAYHVARPDSNARAIARALLKPALAQTATLTALHAVLLYFIVDDAGWSMQLAGLITLFQVPSSLALQYGLRLLQGAQRFASFNVARALPAGAYASGIALLFLLGASSLPLAALAWVGSNAAAGVVALWMGWRSLPSEEALVDAVPARQMVGFGLRGLLAWASPLEALRLDQSVVALFLSPYSLGLYTAALAFSQFPRFLAYGVGEVTYPVVAADRDQRSAGRAAWRFFAFGTAICGLSVLVLELSVGHLVPLFFGAEFSASIGLARILLVAGFFNSVRWVLAQCAAGLGRPGAATISEAASAAVLLPALAVLTGARGIEGTCLAIAASAGFGLLVLAGLLVQPRGVMAAFSSTAGKARGIGKAEAGALPS